MGTEVEIKSNLIVFPSMRDLNEDSNSYSWSIMYGDKALKNGFYQNGLLPRAAADAYLKYDKEILKQTMLEHEAIFRNQVYELHRLYGIQRVLMNEIKKELRGSMGPNETSLASSSLLSQNAFENTWKWQITNGAIASPCQLRQSTSEVMHSPISSAKGETFVASQNGGSLNTSESRPSKVRRKMFDLHLPADEYLDTDEQDLLRDNNSQGTFSSRDQDRKAEAESGAIVFFGKKEIDGKGRTMADLNEPISVDDTNPFSKVEPDRSNSKPSFLGLPREISLNSQLLETGEIRNKDTALHGVWSKSISQLQTQGMFNKVQGTPLYFHGNQKFGLSRDRSFCSFGMSENLKSPESVLHPQSQSQLPFPSSVDLSRSSWPQSQSFWEKPENRQKPLPAQMHQFEASQQAAQNFGISSEKWQERNAVSSSSGFGELPNKQNGFYLGSSSGCKGLSGADNISSLNYDHLKSNDGEVNLNVIPPTGPRDSVFSQGYRLASVERKSGDDRTATLPWLRAKAVGKSEVVVLDDLNSQELKLLDSSPHWLNSKNEAGKLGACSGEVDLKRVGKNGFLNDGKNSGHPVFDRPKNEPLSEEKVDNGRKVRLLDINLPCDPISESAQEHNSAGTLTVERKGSDQMSSHSRPQIIDLNSCLSEDEPCVFLPVMNTDRKHMPVIDLEIPAVPENEEGVFSVQFLEKFQETYPQKPAKMMDDICKTAAQALVSISSSCLKDCPSTTFVDLAESKEDRLNWFVDTILSCGGSNEIGPKAGAFKGKSGGSNDCEFTSEEVDYFELMTLQLIETKSEDYLPEPFVLETFGVVDESAVVATGPGRPRRGQSKRGRQRKDFQRDILPGLTSLSRHEVTEDLQTFGGLMRATGYHTWQSGLTRRNSSRNGSRRGRRRTTATVCVSPSSGSGSPGPTLTPLVQHLSNIETGGFEERQSLTGWGKTTRRPRRQRCHAAGNPPVIHLM